MTYVTSAPTIVDTDGDVELQARTRCGDEGPAVELFIGPSIDCGERKYRMIVPAGMWRVFAREVGKALREEER